MGDMSMSNAKFVFDTMRPAEKKEVFEVKFQNRFQIEAMVRHDIEEIERVTRNQSNVKIPSVGWLMAYWNYLLKLRIKQVNDKLTHEEKTLINLLRVPVRLEVLLAQVGRVSDPTNNFHFVPVYKDPEVEERDEYGRLIPLEENSEGEKVYGFVDLEIDLETVKRISDALRGYLVDGYMTVQGLPKSKNGSLAMMTKACMQDQVFGMIGRQNDHPVYAFFAFLLNAEITSDAYDNLDLLFRVRYSSFDTYELSLKSAFADVMNQGVPRPDGSSDVISAVKPKAEPQDIFAEKPKVKQVVQQPVPDPTAEADVEEEEQETGADID